MLKSLLTAIALMATVPALAAAETDTLPDMIGPVVGEAAPTLEGTTKVTPENAVNVGTQNGTILVFVRSADWCPFCKTQLVDLKPAIEELAEAGWSVQALSYDSPEVLERFAADNALNYVLLSDEDSSEIDAFNLRNTDVRAGTRADGIPHPAVVFIGNDGNVAGILREKGFRERPQVDAILDMVTRLNALEGA